MVWGWWTLGPLGWGAACLPWLVDRSDTEDTLVSSLPEEDTAWETRPVPGAADDDVWMRLTDTAGDEVHGGVVWLLAAGVEHVSPIEQGIAYFEAVPFGTYTLFVVPDPGERRLASVRVPLAVDRRTWLDLELPELNLPAPLSGSSALLDLGEGLWVTASVDDLTPAPFDPPATALAAAAARPQGLPPLHGLPLLGRPDAVVGVWYLDPDSYEAPTGLPVRFQRPDDTFDGEVFSVWTSHLSEPRWAGAGEVTAQGEWVRGDARLPYLSTVVLLRDIEVR